MIIRPFQNVTENKHPTIQLFLEEQGNKIIAIQIKIIY